MLCNYSFMIYYCNMILLYILHYILILFLYVHLLIIFSYIFLAVLPNEKQGTTHGGLIRARSAWYQQWSKSKTKIENEISRKKKIFENVFCELESWESEIGNEKIKKSRFQPYACMCAWEGEKMVKADTFRVDVTI